MPPSLPTGTVSQTSAGTRTFPPDSDRARASATSPQPSRQPQTRQPQSPPSPSPPSPSSVPSAVVPRREHDLAISREHDRVAELERENEALREYISLQVSDKQAVIERYERLLEQREGALRSQSVPEPTSSATASSGSVRELAGAIRSRVRAAGSRLVSRLGLD